MLFVLLTIISGVVEMTTMGDDDVSRIEALMTKPQIEETSGILGTVVGVVGFAWGYLENLWGILWFDYAFFQGQWIIVKYIIFMPISAAMIIAIIFGLKGNSTS